MILIYVGGALVAVGLCLELMKPKVKKPDESAPVPTPKPTDPPTPSPAPKPSDPPAPATA